jgi:hypothetical protein
MHTNRARNAKRGLALLGCVVLVAPCWAQGTPPAPTSNAPAASPRPEELEPGVNTSNAVSAPSSSSPAVAPAGSAPPATPTGTSSSGTPASRSSPATPAVTGKPQAADTGRKAAARTATESGGAQGAAAGKAHDRLELDTTQITGNRELPKVLYIVPWKHSDLGDVLGKPVNSLVDEVLSPVDRDVFKRQNRYYDALKPDAAAKAAGPHP